MSQESPPPRRPYVPPRLLKVQERVPGDQLVTGCKSPSVGGPSDTPCDSGPEPCQFDGS